MPSHATLPLKNDEIMRILASSFIHGEGWEDLLKPTRGGKGRMKQRGGKKKFERESRKKEHMRWKRGPKRSKILNKKKVVCSCTQVWLLNSSTLKPIKIISSGAQYVTLQKCFHIQVWLFTFFGTPPRKLKVGP
jgi:hypothetical protein